VTYHEASACRSDTIRTSTRVAISELNTAIRYAKDQHTIIRYRCVDKRAQHMVATTVPTVIMIRRPFDQRDLLAHIFGSMNSCVRKRSNVRHRCQISAVQCDQWITYHSQGVEAGCQSHYAEYGKHDPDSVCKLRVIG